MPLPLTPIRFLERAATVFSKKIGIVCRGKEFTYGEFSTRCGRLAGALKRDGIQAGDRVAYLSYNTHQLLEGYYGVPLAGAIVMPLNVRLPVEELVQILNHAEARMLMFENDFARHVDLFRRSCPSIEKYVTLDEAVPEADLTSEGMLDGAVPADLDVRSIDEDSIAEVFYTSGSTGTPKGVALSHRTLYLHGLSVATLIRDPNTAVDLHTIPLFHANGWGRPQASTMLGTRQVMVRRFEPSAVLRLIEQYRATEMSLVPTMANALLNAPDLRQHDLSSMRTIMIGGAAASPELIERMETAFGCDCWAGYGLTETVPVICCARQKPGLEYASPKERYRRQAMTGWPVPGVELLVVDARMNEVPRDGRTIGEIVVRGDHLMSGYYREPEATAAVFSGEWFHTGDMAVWDEEMYFHIVDRSKEIIISGGENISSIEVERAIFAHPDVLECAVVAAPDEKWGEVPAAVVVLKPGSALTNEALLEFVSPKLGHFKLPRQIQFAAEPLPKTGTGKIRKREIREQFWTGRERRVQG